MPKVVINPNFNKSAELLSITVKQLHNLYPPNYAVAENTIERIASPLLPTKYKKPQRVQTSLSMEAVATICCVLCIIKTLQELSKTDKCTITDPKSVQKIKTVRNALDDDASALKEFNDLIKRAKFPVLTSAY